MTANRRDSAGHSWEVYGDPTPDPTDTETTVVYLLNSVHVKYRSRFGRVIGNMECKRNLTLDSREISGTCFQVDSKLASRVDYACI
jgi:hypothetical protein